MQVTGTRLGKSRDLIQPYSSRVAQALVNRANPLPFDSRDRDGNAEPRALLDSSTLSNRAGGDGNHLAPVVCRERANAADLALGTHWHRLMPRNPSALALDAGPSPFRTSGARIAGNDVALNNFQWREPPCSLDPALLAAARARASTGVAASRDVIAVMTVNPSPSSIDSVPQPP